MPSDPMRHRRLVLLVLACLALACRPAFAQQKDPDTPDDPFGPETPYDPQEALKRRQELTALSRALQKLLKDKPNIRRTRPDDFARAQLKLEKCALLFQRYYPSAARDVSFGRERDEGRRVIAALADGKPAPLARTGMIERAYLCDIDRSAQPYYVYVPDTVDLAKPAPLLLFLHGYIGDLDKVNWVDQTLSESMKTLAEKTRGLLLVPFARSNTDFLGIGERDVLKTIALVKRDYRIDADRVVLCGASMGASGVWAIAAHTPHLFAAAVPASGRSDYNLWQNVPRGTLTPFKQFIIDRDFATTLKPNFRNLPVFAFHGELDFLVRPDQSRKMIGALKGLGFDARYEEFPRGDHWSCFDAFDSENLIAWVTPKTRAPGPKRVTYTTYHPRFNEAHWVRIDDFVAFGTPAHIDATRAAPDLVTAQVVNIARVTLGDGRGFVATDALRLRLQDGRTLKPTAVKEGRATFEIAAVAAGGLRKRGEVCGPIYEAYQRPFLMVFGTQGEAEGQLRSRNLASLAMLEWFEFAAGIPRVKKDTDVTDDDVKRFNLILFGTPTSNAMLARIAPRLPVKIEEDRFTIAGKTYAGKDLGLALIYPNPLNPERTVVVYSGVRWGKGLPKNHKLDLLPDFIVFDDTIAPVSGTNTFKVAGFFDIDWKLEAKLTWTDPEKAPPAPEFPGWDDPWKDDAPENGETEAPKTP